MLSLEFVLAGRAVFTVNNDKGDHYTFKVVKKETASMGPIWFAMLLTGPDNTNDYTYMGCIDAQLGFRLTGKSKFKMDSVPVKVLVWTLRHVFMMLELPAGYKIHHEGKCGRCGRALTVPSSVESGIGPECAKIMMGVC